MSTRQIGRAGMQRIPYVADGLLSGTPASGAAGLTVGSPAWFAWLAGDAARSFSVRSPAGAYTARKERRQRGGAYWVAYRTAAGRQHKVYLGKGEELTPERLAEAGAALAVRIDQAPEALLLSTKLFVPRPRPDLVPRPRLIAHLNAGLDTARCSRPSCWSNASTPASADSADDCARSPARQPGDAATVPAAMAATRSW